MRTFVVAMMLMVSATSVLSQGSGNIHPTEKLRRANVASVQRASEAQNLFGEYNTKYRNGGVDARKILDRIYAAGLPQSADNVKSLRALLSSTVTSDEKVALVRILGTLYTLDNKTGMNSVITQDLRGLVHDPNKEVAKTAMFSYSRLGYFPDTEDMLLHLKNAGVIDNEGYYGELAHILPFAPAHAQMDLLSKITMGKNKYATEILAFLPNNPDNVQRLYPETKQRLLAYLQEDEPGFGMETGVFGLTDAVRYTTWLHSIATLTRETTSAKYSDVVLNHLNNEKTDPRKIMAFLISAEGKYLINELGRPELFENARKRITQYSKQHPQNEMMRDAVQEIANTINTVKR